METKKQPIVLDSRIKKIIIGVAAGSALGGLILGGIAGWAITSSSSTLSGRHEAVTLGMAAGSVLATPLYAQIDDREVCSPGRITVYSQDGAMVLQRDTKNLQNNATVYLPLSYYYEKEK